MVLQNNVGNKYSLTVIIANITSRIKPNLPTHVHIGDVSNLSNDSHILLEQIQTIDKKRVKEYFGTLSPDQMEMVNKALRISFTYTKETKCFLDFL